MAVGRLPTVAPQTAPQPAGRARASAAQAAFFQAALGKAEAPVPARAAETRPAEAVSSVRETRVAAPDELPRGYRPGALLDVKI